MSLSLNSKQVDINEINWPCAWIADSVQYFIPMHGMRTLIPQGVNAAVPQKYFKYQFKIRKKEIRLNKYLG